jgi:AcrR family transcriptional regulator
MATTRNQIANTPRPGQGDSTRAAILAAARDVFTAEGYRAATVDGIAAAAGFTKGAFYRHFGSKAAAYAAVLEDAAGTAWKLGTSRVAAAETMEEAVSEYVDLVVAFYQRAPFRIGTQLEALVEAEHDPEMRESAAKAFAGGRARLTRALEQAAAREGRQPAVPPDDLAGMLVGNTMGAVSQWRVDAEVFDLQRWGETTKTVVNAVLRRR